MTALVDDLMPDELWPSVEPLLPARTSTPWQLLPARELTLTRTEVSSSGTGSKRAISLPMAA